MTLKPIGEQTTAAERRRRAGQRLLIGFHGSGVPDEVRWLCQETAPAGFIVFSRNIEDPAQARELNRELASLLPRSHPPLLSIDQEGGRVQRLPGTTWPPARWVGNVDNPATTARLGAAMGRELYAAGFNTTWSPVADVSNKTAASIIGDRSFSGDPRRAARHTAAFLRGLDAAGVIGCAKHFPGHGATIIDSHRELPAIERECPEVEATDLPPFRAAISAGVGLIMTAHAMFPAWDEDRPASLSHRLTTGLLREELGFEDGVIVTDDLEMEGLARWSPPERIQHAADAGADLLMLCHTPHLQLAAYEQLVHMQEDVRGNDQRFIDASKRLMRLRERAWLGRPPQPDLSIIGCQSHIDLAYEIRARGSE
ncbi:MAG: beta-N-acetylhexosaminidase [Myxococcota bacterium]